MADNDAPKESVPDEHEFKLQLFKSPVVPGALGHVQSRPSAGPDQNGVPQLVRHNEAINLEVFYDLFLACLSLFNESRVVATIPGLSSYIGFFGLLWTTWLLTGLYDVRFLADSVVERLAKAVHFGVLVGFVVTSPNFDPNKQEPGVFQTFSLILMISRICLAAEYGSFIYHVRAYSTKFAKLPLVIMTVQNVVVALIYMGISFRFKRGNSQVFYTWYALAAIEVALTVGLSVYYRLLTFEGTHLIQRMSLLTLIIFGEGIAVVSKGITEVVDIGHSEWTPGTIGVATACVATIYVVFMIYSDWMRQLQLSGWRQLAWTLLHFPLHLALTLFLEGCGHFVVFHKVAEVEADMWEGLDEVLEDPDTVDDSQLVTALENWTEAFQGRFQPTYGYQAHVINDTFRDMRELLPLVEQDPPLPDDKVEEILDRFVALIETLLFTLDNMAYAALGIDFLDDAVEGMMEIDAVKEHEISMANLAANLNERTYRRFLIVFTYTFVCGCGVLILANVLYCLALGADGWRRRWPLVRTLVNCIVAVAVGLVALVAIDDFHLWSYRNTPWVVPTILIPFLVVVALNHLHAPSHPPAWAVSVLSWFRKRRGKKAVDDPETVHQGDDRSINTQSRTSGPEVNGGGAEATELRQLSTTKLVPDENERSTLEGRQ